MAKRMAGITAAAWAAPVAARRAALRAAAAAALVIAQVLAPPPVAANPVVTLKIESWRYDDLPVWRDTLIPAFEKANPGIRVVFAPTPPHEYNAALENRLARGTAGDLITCRPFDTSQRLHKLGHLPDLSGLPGLQHFPPLARLAWSTDDGASTYCVPIASVIHGFIYNAEAFKALRVEAPQTWDQFFSVLQRFKADGRWIPLIMGTKDTWEGATLGYQNIGPAFYGGEEGRRALLAGTAKLTDARWVEPWRVLARWRPYLGEGFEAQTYPDSQNLFLLGLGAVYPAGSWEVADFEKQAGLKLGVFKPPRAAPGDRCQVTDHPDLGLGLNAKTAHPKEARRFLEWVASPPFAALYANALPGFFSLNAQAPLQVASPLARSFAAWRSECATTIRPTYQWLMRGTPNLEDEFWRTSAAVIEGQLTPEAAGQHLQGVLQRGHKPRP
jgi:raffinose/stachyose/melibiose transport system substrate-binding protein